MVEDRIVGEIGSGLLILLGVRHDDMNDDAEYLAQLDPSNDLARM